MLALHVMIALAQSTGAGSRHADLSSSVVCADAYDPTVGGAHGGFRQGRGFRHPMAHPDIERAANGPGPRTVRYCSCFMGRPPPRAADSQ